VANYTLASLPPLFRAARFKVQRRQRPAQRRNIGRGRPPLVYSVVHEKRAQAGVHFTGGRFKALVQSARVMAQPVMLD